MLFVRRNIRLVYQVYFWKSTASVTNPVLHKTSTGSYRSCAAVLHFTNLLRLFRTGLVKFGQVSFLLVSSDWIFTNTKEEKKKSKEIQSCCATKKYWNKGTLVKEFHILIIKTLMMIRMLTPLIPHFVTTDLERFAVFSKFPSMSNLGHKSMVLQEFCRDHVTPEVPSRRTSANAERADILCISFFTIYCLVCILPPVIEPLSFLHSEQLPLIATSQLNFDKY